MLKETLNTSFSKNLKLNNYIIKVRVLQDITIVSMICAMLSFLIYYYAQDKITIGDFVFILILSNTIFKSIWFLASKFLSIYEIIGKCNQALMLISQKSQILDFYEHNPLLIKGEISLNDVEFSYSDVNDKVFNKLSLKIKAGTKIGVVGLSGNGKSTLAKLLLRFYDIQKGEILIDNISINCLSQKSLRDNISYVPQDVMLFHRTIYENIFCGNIKSAYSEVIAASRMANCHDFITMLPEGYNSVVGERGVKLSGGQRQRIAIARAFLKKSPIIIFDEASSSLDSATEKSIHNNLFNFIGNSTAIIIAHRLSTICSLDRIIVFDKGIIVEDGTHEDLLLTNGIYKKLWDKQSLEQKYKLKIVK